MYLKLEKLSRASLQREFPKIQRLCITTENNLFLSQMSRYCARIFSPHKKNRTKVVFLEERLEDYMIIRNKARFSCLFLFSSRFSFTYLEESYYSPYDGKILCLRSEDASRSTIAGIRIRNNAEIRVEIR